MTAHDRQFTSTVPTTVPPPPVPASPRALEAGDPQEVHQAWLDALALREVPASVPGTQLAHDAYDVAAWRAMQGAYGRLQQAVATARQHCASAPALLQDLFMSFSRAAPAFSSAAPSPLDRIHRDLLSEVFQTREWQELRETIAAQAALQQTMRTLGNLAGDGALEMGRAPLKEKLDLAQRLQRSQKLQEIALLCGQMQAFAHAVQQAKLEETPEEIDGVTLGRELGQLLPGELALWDDPDTELIFLKGFVEGRLWQYDLHCARLEGQGPIIVALDSSGSMADVLDGGSKEVWSKAVALSLLSIARQQQRDIAVLHFSGGVTTYRFARGQATLTELATCAEHFDRGGTNFEPWMREALHLVDTAAFDRADVIRISDGLTHISEEVEEEWNRRRRERGMRVFGILLEEDEEMREEGAAVFARIADVSLPLATLSDQAAIAEVFAL